MLNDFFRINLPYGIKKNENNEWAAFNREYLPLGFIDINFKQKLDFEIPIYTKYYGITERFLLEIANNSEGSVIRDENGEIKMIFFYNDSTNPLNFKNCKNAQIAWNAYFNKLKKLSKLKKKIG